MIWLQKNGVSFSNAADKKSKLQGHNEVKCQANFPTFVFVLKQKEFLHEIQLVIFLI